MAGMAISGQVAHMLLRGAAMINTTSLVDSQAAVTAHMCDTTTPAPVSLVFSHSVLSPRVNLV
jgi:hypothetical protein